MDNNQQINLLIVEDDITIRKMLQFFLEFNKFNVQGVENGQEATEIIQTQQVDLIMLDTMMPVMNGFQFLQHLKSSEYARIPVVSLTAMQTQTSEQELLDAGAEAVLFKPIGNDLLLQTIKNILAPT